MATKNTNSDPISKGFLAIGDMSRLLGLEQSSIKVYVKREIIPAKGVVKWKNKNYYHLYDTVLAYINFLRVDGSVSKSADKGVIDKSYEDARLKKISADIKQIEYDELVGDLVLAKDVRKQAYSVASNARKKLLSLPNKLSPQLAGVCDIAEISTILKKEITGVMDEISKKYKK